MPRQRRGVSLVYVCVAMFVLIGFCSLAVDLGRVQVAKSELERTADAAARAGAASLSSGVSAVQTAAHNVAVGNTCDGSAVSIDSVNNVVFLNWPSTTPLVGSAQSSANAVQVNINQTVPLIFAQALGMNSVVVHATSTAQAATASSPTYQIASVMGSTFNNSSYTDSWNSNNGAYSAGTAGNRGSFASNGQFTMNSGSKVNGNYYSYEHQPVLNGGSTITGTTTIYSPRNSPVTPTTPAGATSLGSITLNNNGTTTLTAGNYSSTGITLNSGSTLTVNAASGVVNLYMSGAFTMNGGAVNVTGNIPNNFHIYVVNSSALTLNSSSTLCAVVFMPVGAFTMNHSNALFGSITAQTITLYSGSAIHYDQALGTNGGSGSAGAISQVQ